MTLFENAEKFFHTCETLAGWEACKDMVADNATFAGQCEPLTEIKTVEGYVNWVTALGKNIAPGCSYELHASGFDKEKHTAIFFATFIGTHSGDGGPVPPTKKTTHTHYVYAIKTNDAGKVVSITKIWNASWAMRELGWM